MTSVTSVYAEHRPRRAPGRFVVCTWTQANVGTCEYRQLVVPDGCSDLIWQDGRLQLVGPDRAAWRAGLAPGSAIAGVRLRPGAARLLLGRMPVDEVRGLQVPLDTVPRSLTDRLAAAESAQEAAEMLDEFVAELTPEYEPDTAVEQAVRMLKSDHTPRVRELADAVGISERQLRRRFTEAVGYGPKTLHSILRFQRALDLSRRGSPPASLADIAYQAGYADQAHFTREVRRLAGMTPTELIGSGA
jgi:AraC-like DNA-binding protein